MDPFLLECNRIIDLLSGLPHLPNINTKTLVTVDKVQDPSRIKIEVSRSMSEMNIRFFLKKNDRYVQRFDMYNIPETKGYRMELSRFSLCQVFMTSIRKVQIDLDEYVNRTSSIVDGTYILDKLLDTEFYQGFGSHKQRFFKKCQEIISMLSDLHDLPKIDCEMMYDLLFNKDTAYIIHTVSDPSSKIKIKFDTDWNVLCGVGWSSHNLQVMDIVFYHDDTIIQEFRIDSHYEEDGFRMKINRQNNEFITFTEEYPECFDDEIEICVKTANWDKLYTFKTELDLLNMLKDNSFYHKFNIHNVKASAVIQQANRIAWQGFRKSDKNN